MRRAPWRVLRALVVLDVLLLLVAVTAWLLLQRGAGEENVLNDGLRGSRPPAGQQVPDLSRIPGIEPRVPSPQELRGASVGLVATCLDCRSGDVIGGFLGRLRQGDLPRSARLLVVAWEGDADRWARRWRVDRELVELHVARAAPATEAVRRRLGVGAGPRGGEESGMLFLHDARGRWRSSWFLGQLDRDGVLHDLAALAPRA